MNKESRIIVFLIVTLTALCFLAVFIFTLPNFYKNLNLTTTGSIGDSIGGMTAPVIGIISSILLYLTLSRQIETITDQKLKNESDIIFLLINQLDAEIASFYTKKNHGSQIIKYYGVEGLNHFTDDFQSEDYSNESNITFKDFFESKQILLILKSFKLIENRIEIANLSYELKNLFKEKLHYFFECRLKDWLNNISIAIDKNPNLVDEITSEIQQFMD